MKNVWRPKVARQLPATVIAGLAKVGSPPLRVVAPETPGSSYAPPQSDCGTKIFPSA